MKVTRCYLIARADGKFERTRNRSKGEKAYDDGLEVVETESITIHDAEDESVSIVVNRRWRRD